MVTAAQSGGEFGEVARPERAVEARANSGASSLRLELPRLARERGVLAFLGLTGIPTILNGAASVAVPLLLFRASGSEALVAAYGLANALLARLSSHFWGASPTSAAPGFR